MHNYIICVHVLISTKTVAFISTQFLLAVSVGKKKKKETATDSKQPPVITSSTVPDMPKKFDGKLDESMKGFEKIMKDLGQEKPIKGEPIEELVTMEGNFKEGNINKASSSTPLDNETPKSTVNDRNKKRTDFFKEDL